MGRDDVSLLWGFVRRPRQDNSLPQPRTSYRRDTAVSELCSIFYSRPLQLSSTVLVQAPILTGRDHSGSPLPAPHCPSSLEAGAGMTPGRCVREVSGHTGSSGVKLPRCESQLLTNRVTSETLLMVSLPQLPRL